MLALFDLGGGQILLIFALGLIFLGAGKIPEIARELGRGMSEFRDAADEEAREAGRSVGGIFGKPAAQAIAPDNKVAELYDPEALEEEPQQRRRWKGLFNALVKLWLQISNI